MARVAVVGGGAAAQATTSKAANAASVRGDARRDFTRRGRRGAAALPSSPAGAAGRRAGPRFRRARALVVGERTVPSRQRVRRGAGSSTCGGRRAGTARAGARLRELNGASVVDERETRERQRHARERGAGRGGQAGSETVVIEGGALCRPCRIDQDEDVAASHGLPVPEPARVADPGGRLREAVDLVADPIRQTARPVVVRLDVRRLCRQQNW